MTEAEKVHRISENPILKFFEYRHLPPHLQTVSTYFHDMVWNFVEDLEPSAERTTLFRKLLEAKDCAVRCALSKTI